MNLRTFHKTVLMYIAAREPPWLGEGETFNVHETKSFRGRDILKLLVHVGKREKKGARLPWT